MLGASLHRLLHEVRSQFIKFTYSANRLSPERDEDKKHYSELVQNLTDNITLKIEKFFAALIGAKQDKDIACAIRLAVKRFDENKKDWVREYVTISRSGEGLSQNRAIDSEALPHEEGIAKALRDREKRVTIIVSDIKKAMDAEMWRRDAHSETLDDIKSLIIGPINQYLYTPENEKKNYKVRLLGILYIISCQKGGDRTPFKPFHSEYVKAIGDLLGTLFPILKWDSFKNLY